jgi:hypothetical protein
MSLEHSPARDGKGSSAAVESEFLDEYQAAALLNVGVRSLRRWRGEGRGPAFMKFSSMVRYKRAVLMAWAEAQQRNSTAA